MFRRYLVGFVIALFIVNSAQAGPAQGVSEDEVVFGTHTPLSGPAAIWGVGSVNAIRMHFDEINEQGGAHGRKLRLVVEDSQYQVPRAIQAANKLLNRDKVFAMLVPLGTPMNNAVLPRQLAMGVPNLFPYTGARSMARPFHPLKFTIFSTYYDQTRAAVKYFTEKKGKDKICVQYQDTDFGQEVYEATTDQLAAMNRELTASATHKPTDTDFSASMAKLRKADCDLVVLGTIIKDTIMAVATARKMGWDVDFVGVFASVEQMVAEYESGVMEGYYGMASFTPQYQDSSDPEIRDWMDRYQENYGELPSSGAVIGHVAAELVVETLQRAGRELTVESFIQALESIDHYEVFGTTVSFSPEKHEAVTRAQLMIIKDGRWHAVTEPISY